MKRECYFLREDDRDNSARKNKQAEMRFIRSELLTRSQFFVRVNKTNLKTVNGTDYYALIFS